MDSYLKPACFGTRWKILVLVVLVGFVSSCSIGFDASGWQVLDKDKAKLGNTVFVMYMSPGGQELLEFNPKTSHGYVVLVDDKGDISAIKNSGMDVGKVLWDEKGLFFSDTKHDYLLTDKKLHVVDSPKDTNLQDGLFSEPNGNGYVGVFNVGYTSREDGYTVQVVQSDGKKSVSYNSHGEYVKREAFCGKTMYGVSPLLGDRNLKYATEEEKRIVNDPNNHAKPRMLKQIYPKPASEKASIISIHKQKAGTDTHPFTVPVCVNNVLYFLLMTDSGKPDVFYLGSWDTKTGELTEKPLRTLNGELLATATEGVNEISASNVRLAPMLDKKGRLLWYWSNGKVYATNLTNGITTATFDTGIPYRQKRAELEVQIQDNWLFVLVCPEDKSKPLTLNRYDLRSGAKKVMMNINKVNAKRFQGQNIRGLAFSKQLTS